MEHINRERHLPFRIFQRNERFRCSLRYTIFIIFYLIFGHIYAALCFSFYLDNKNIIVLLPYLLLLIPYFF